LIYEPAIIEDGVFIGPNVVLTNDKNPRAVNVDGTKKNESDWEKAGALIKQGASIGASAVIVAPITVGSWSMVSAGAVVVKDVPDYALVAGVPAQKIGWVGKAGRTQRAEWLHLPDNFRYLYRGKSTTVSQRFKLNSIFVNREAHK
jgi:acetyltransferase-like isoleucine patch superfamily enzyme